jgi:hypothetical protein
MAAVLCVAVVATVAIVTANSQSSISHSGFGFVNLLSAFAALAAVILAIRGIQIQQRVASASVIPILSIRHIKVGTIRIVLHNDGLGPALLKKVTYTKDNNSQNSIPLVLEKAKAINWDKYAVFSGEDVPLRAGDQHDLLVLSTDELKKQGFNETRINETFRMVNDELKGLKISVEIDNVLGKRQPRFEVTLN